MSRRTRRTGNVTETAVAFGLLAMVVVAVVPVLAFIAGIAVLIWLGVTVLRSVARDPERDNNTADAAPTFDAMMRDANAALSQLSRSDHVGVWLGGIVKASELLAALQRECGLHSMDPSSTPIPGLEYRIYSTCCSVARVLEIHFATEASKLMMATPKQRVKIANRALTYLTEIAAAHPCFGELSTRHSTVFSQFTLKTRQSKQYSAHMAAAKRLELADSRGALDLYLNLLHSLRTDGIDDVEQESQITEVENCVRRLVRTMAKTMWSRES